MRPAGGYDHVVATRDHHIDPGAHFAEHPDFLDTWPAHCVVGTGGVELHPDLDRQPIEAVFDKGEYAAAYSGFEGAADGVGRWPTGCASAASTPSTSWASPPTTACAPPRWTPSATASPPACCSTSPPAWPRRSTEAALEQLRAAGVELRAPCHRALDALTALRRAAIRRASSDLVAGEPEDLQDGVEVGLVERRVRLLADDRLGVERDAEARRR